MNSNACAMALFDFIVIIFMKKAEYIVIVSNSTDEVSLESKVNSKILEGWTPQGGISISLNDYVLVMAQAMILLDK